MTAFLFIPSTCGAKVARRVDFTNIGSLFAEADEAAASDLTQGMATRVLTMLLIALFAIGDMVLVARPDVLMHSAQTAPTIAVEQPASL